MEGSQIVLSALLPETIAGRAKADYADIGALDNTEDSDETE